jgi:hypothetical protein
MCVGYYMCRTYRSNGRTRSFQMGGHVAFRWQDFFRWQNSLLSDSMTFSDGKTRCFVHSTMNSTLSKKLVFNVPWLEGHSEPDYHFAFLNVP